MSDSRIWPPAGYVAEPSGVPGIEVYKPAPRPRAEHRETIEFHCCACGATTAYSVVEGSVTCAQCGHVDRSPTPQDAPSGAGSAEKPPRADTQSFEFDLQTLERSARGWGSARKEIACSGCGATITVPDGDLTATCPFCASNKVIQREAPQDALRPRLLIPFQIEPTQLGPIVRRWIGRDWLTPRDLHTSAQFDRFRPTFLPYWDFASRVAGTWQADVGDDETRETLGPNGERRTDTVTHWHHESGAVERDFKLLVPATTKARRLDEIGNFDASRMVAYDATYLAGSCAQAYDVPLEDGWTTGRQHARETVRTACRASIHGDRVSNFVMSLDFADETWRYVLLPVYMAAYRYGGQTYNIIVNGQTGAIAGRRPVNRKRMRWAIGAALAPGVLLSLVGLVTLAMGVGAVMLAGGLVLLFFGGMIASGIRDKVRAMDAA